MLHWQSACVRVDQRLQTSLLPALVDCEEVVVEFEIWTLLAGLARLEVVALAGSCFGRGLLLVVGEVEAEREAG
jgi:hypothetical protein